MHLNNEMTIRSDSVLAGDALARFNLLHLNRLVARGDRRMLDLFRRSIDRSAGRAAADRAGLRGRAPAHPGRGAAGDGAHAESVARRVVRGEQVGRACQARARLKAGTPLGADRFPAEAASACSDRCDRGHAGPTGSLSTRHRPPGTPALTAKGLRERFHLPYFSHMKRSSSK